MQTKTINEAVRDYLLEKDLPIHYYFTTLHKAITCLNELSFDFDFGPNVKEVPITRGSDDRCVIPVDCVDPIGVYGLIAGEIRPFLLNQKLTTIRNVVDAVNSPYTKSDNSLPKKAFGEIVNLATMAEQNIQIINLRDTGLDYEYNIDINNSEIILKPGSEVEKIYFRYLSGLVSKTSANVIHPYTQPVISAYIEYSTEKSEKGALSRIAELRSYYYNEKTLLRNRLSPFSTDDLLQILYFN